MGDDTVQWVDRQAALLGDSLAVETRTTPRQSSTSTAAGHGFTHEDPGWTTIREEVAAGQVDAEAGKGKKRSECFSSGISESYGSVSSTRATSALPKEPTSDFSSVSVRSSVTVGV